MLTFSQFLFRRKRTTILLALLLLICNCRVIDLGVMTPCEKILETAIKENAGIGPLELSFKLLKAFSCEECVLFQVITLFSQKNTEANNCQWLIYFRYSWFVRINHTISR